MEHYYLIGEQLGHSFSAEIHRGFGRYDYELLALPPAELGPFLKSRAFAGLNVTIPYKQAVIPYLDRLDSAAAAIGAVNTVVKRGGLLYGYNTDFGGMAAALRRLCGPGASADRPCEGKSVLILGTGGSSRTAMAVCRALGAAEIRRVSRSGKDGALLYAEAARCADAGLIVNTTPVGMWPDLDATPLELSPFSHAAVFDCVYNPLRTRLVLEARALGLPAAGGLFMLVRQAALACGLFTGAPPEDSQADRLLARLRASRENIVLIGMPGAGKSTLGRLLAQNTGRRLVDTDEEVERRAGKPISAIFAEQGAAAFRALEADVVRDSAASSGIVVATGGGTVLRAENLRRLRQNGRLVLLDRPLAELEPSDARPLGDTAEKLAALYAARSPLYRAAAELRVPVTGSPAQTAAAILAGWEMNACK